MVVQAQDRAILRALEGFHAHYVQGTAQKNGTAKPLDVLKLLEVTKSKGLGKIYQ